MLLATLLASTMVVTRPVLSRDPAYFPIGVWLQSPANARRYKDLGINLYIGLWEGPKEEQIRELEAAKMPVICDLNDWARKNLDRSIIVGWMHNDEPDNAQAKPEGGWGPPIPPDRIVEDYAKIRKTDPKRPVFMNLGQGVAWDGWIGRGERTNKPEDYPRYTKGTDIVSFDIYPVTADHADVRGRLEKVGFGTARLRRWAAPDQPVWACIEATRIGNPNVKPTPAQTRTLAWMAIINGATGLVYFSHQFAPKFIEAGILDDPEMSEGIRRTNAEIRALAPVLNAKSLPVDVQGNAAVLVKRHGRKTHVFAISMTNEPVQFTARIKGLSGNVTGGGTLSGEALKDRLGPYEMRHYTITAPKSTAHERTALTRSTTE